MTVAELLPSLEAVHARGHGRWSARCPAHADTSPSLTIAEGEKGVLLKCWAGCSLEEITGTLGLTVKDLFFDALSTDPHQRRSAAQQRAQARAVRQAALDAEGRRLDALKVADYHIRSRQGVDISGWSDQKLDDELIVLADAYLLLASEECDG